MLDANALRPANALVHHAGDQVADGLEHLHERDAQHDGDDPHQVLVIVASAAVSLIFRVQNRSPFT